MAKRKIVLVGCGAVGSSFIYSAINQGLAQEYVLIDAFEGIAEGNAIDFADCQAALDHPFISIKAGNYSNCKDADIIVITAGRPQKDGETRLNMVADNAKIMKSIALEIKKSGFKGVTIIASNPVDIMTTVYQKITQFDYHQVLGSGTILDTLCLQYLIGEKIAVNPKSVAAYVIGEHGDSSMIPWSSVSVGNKTIYQQITEGRIKEKDLEELRKEVAQRAYKIIKLKRATFYGIGAALALLVRNILEGQNHVLVAGSVYISHATRSSTAKFLLIGLVIMVFALSGFSHVVANFYVWGLGPLFNIYGIHSGFNDFLQFGYQVQLPTLFGNFIGGGILLPGMYYLIFRKELPKITL